MKCTVNGCERKSVAHGFCAGHLEQYWKYGKIVHQKLRTPTGRKKMVEYNSWRAMKERCYNKKSMAYRNYGGRGIIVCDRWLDRAEGFTNFLADMGRRPDGCSLDRVDVNGPYCPENCRWASRQQQNINRRFVKTPFITTRETMSGIRYDVRVRDLKYKGEYVYRRGTFRSLEEAIRNRDIYIKELRKGGIHG